MKPIEPMLAKPYEERRIISWDQWMAEIKYNGHRLGSRVGGPVSKKNLFDDQVQGVMGWSRPNARRGGEMVERPLPSHLVQEMAKLPRAYFDGELVVDLADGTATDVTRKDQEKNRAYVIFDVLEMDGTDTTDMSYVDRRSLLETIFKHFKNLKHVRLATALPAKSEENVLNYFKKIRAGGGEGLILKRRGSRYLPGKRPYDWLKLKAKEHATLEVVGFKPTRGEVLNRGPFAIVELRDKDGNPATVKTRNDAELERFQQVWDDFVAKRKGSKLATTKENIDIYHPDIGRLLVIEFPKRTRTGGYEGPVIWDRWEDE